jgi:monomeric sarcosine oxidase
MGSAAAYHLAQDGRRVLLVEQFTMGHTHGSSHGGSRIIRYTHDDVAYVRLMPAIFELWRRLEAESGASLLQMTGGLYIGPEDEPFLRGAQHALHTLQHPYQVWSPDELPDHFPQFRLPPGWLALYQEESGILAATRCVETLVRQAVHHGVTVREETRVQSVLPDGDGVTVRLAGAGGEETIHAAQAVITAGPWIERLLAPLLPYRLPLQVTHQQVAYYAVEQPEIYRVGRCPLYIFTALPHFYGFPIFERAGEVKIGMERVGSVVDPDEPRTVAEAALGELSAAIERSLVGVRPEPTRVELCLYTETPNHHFIIDRHPEHPQILMAGGFSGRGFKFGIAVGRLLADLAASAPGVYESKFWLPRFAVTRFSH